METFKTIDECFYLIQNGANIKQGQINGGYPITRIETISNDKFNRDKVGYAGIFELGKYASYVLEDGDLLMSHINSPQYLGRTVLYKKKDSEIIIHGMNLLRLKANVEIINPGFARYLFYSVPFRRQIAKITKKSVNQASFSINDLKKISIVIPSLSVQEKIVKKLNSAISVKNYYERQIELLDELVKARFVEMFGDPMINPYEWKVINISEVLRAKASNGFFSRRDDYCDDGNVEVLGVANVVNRMYSQVVDLPRTNANEKDIEKFEVKYGDMLFCRSSLVAEGIGKASIIPEGVQTNILFECHVIRLPLDLDKCVPEFLQTLSTTKFFRNQIISKSKTATMTTIGQDGILKTNIILPPLEKQKEYYNFVKQIDKSRLRELIAIKQIQLLLNDSWLLFY